MSRWKVVAVADTVSVIVQAARNAPDLTAGFRLRCVETETLYEVAGWGMIPADAHERGLRMVALKPVGKSFDLREGMTLEECPAAS